MDNRAPAAHVWCWVVVSAALIAWAILNPAPPTWDEQVSLRSSAKIWHGDGSLISRLSAYDAPQGPVAFLIAGLPAGEDASGVAGTRLLTAATGVIALALAMSLGSTIGAYGPVPGPLLMGGALLLMPYFLFMSTRFYTDVPALLSLLATLAFWLRGRYGWAGLMLAVAVGTRQYALFAWIALAAVEVLAPRGERSWKRTARLLAPAVLVLGVLFYLWGGLAPRSVASAAILRRAGSPEMGFVNYYLACIGVYTGWSLLLRREWKGLVRPLLLAVAASPAFWLFVPGPNEYFLSRGGAIYRLGFVDRVVTALVGEGAPRSLCLWLLWMIGILCLARIARDWKQSVWSPLAICWALSFLGLHSMASHAWDKYLLPLQVPLVLALLSRPRGVAHRGVEADPMPSPNSVKSVELLSA